MPTGENLERFFFPNLSRGMSETIPPTMMSNRQDGPLWTLLKNIRPHDGELRRSEAIDTIGTLPPLVGAAPSPAPAGAWDSTDNNIQTPVFIKSYLEGEFVMVVTTQEIWWYVAATDSWVSLNPIYDEDSESDGTGTGTGPHQIETAILGGTTFTDPGGDLLFLTRNISAGMPIILDPAGAAGGPVTRLIDVVNSETSITVTGGATGISATTPIDFEITRTFRTEFFFPMFADVFNGNLFVSGRTASAGSLSTSGSAAAILKVRDVYRTTVTGQDAFYLMGAVPLHDDGSTFDDGDNIKFFEISTLDEIQGMQFLGDGRTVLGVWEADAFGATLNRIRYSDHLDEEEYDPFETSSTAGFSDRTEYSNRITALGRFGNSLTVHFPEGIVWAHPTGEQSPPLTYQPVIGVYQGCVLTKSLQQTPVGQIFVGTDHQILLFDGSKVQEVGYDLRGIIGENWGYTPFIHSSLDWYRSEYSLFILDVNPINIQPWRSWSGMTAWRLRRGLGTSIRIAEDDSTLEMMWDWTTGEWRIRNWDGAITAVSKIERNNPGSTWETRLDGEAIMGVPSLSGLDWLDGQSSVGAGQAATDLIYRLREQITTLPSIDPGGTTKSFDNNGFDFEGCTAMTDDIDVGVPGVYKYYRYVQLWLGRFILDTGLTNTFRVGLSTDEGKTFTDQDVIVAGSADTPAEFIIQFYYDTVIGQKVRIRIQILDSPFLLCSIRKMALWYQIAGQIEANVEEPGVLAGDIAA